MANGALLREQYEGGRRFTYADYREWELDEGERYELIHGEAYAMSAPNAYHQSILMGAGKANRGFYDGETLQGVPYALRRKAFL